MYQAIIADDEKKICTLIQKLGRWDDLGIEVVDICLDGLDALHSILVCKPDIVITDIRMPGLDGLELIRRASEQGQNPYFIMISGYKYFEYAYTAMKYGVVDYLLKPIEAEELNRTLKKTCEELERRQKQKREEERRNRQKRTEDSRERKLILDLTERPDYIPETIEKLNAEYGTQFSYKMYLPFYLTCSRRGEKDGLLWNSRVIECGARILCGEQIQSLLVADEEGICGILNFDKARTEGAKNRLESFFADIQTLGRAQGMRMVVMGLGDTITECRMLAQSLQKAKEREEAKMVLGGWQIIDEQAASFSRLPAGIVWKEEERRRFIDCLETLNAERMRNYLNDLSGLSRYTPPLSPACIREIRDWMLQQLRAYGEDSGDAWRAFSLELCRDTENANGIEDFFMILREEIVEYVGILREEHIRRESQPVRLAKAYIEENYVKQLSLADVAKEVGLSEAYFSSLFKKYTGSSFVEYLTQVRIQAAKKYLRSTGYTNGVIAEKVGYTDDKYFQKVFKKNTGIRPGEYRKLHGRERNQT